MVKQWFIRFEKKKKDFLHVRVFNVLFYLCSIYYQLSPPLLSHQYYSSQMMEFHFSLSVTITDFFLPRHSKQMLSLTQKNLPKVKISPKFSEYTCTFTNAFSLSFLEFMVPWGLCGQGSGVISQGSGLHF